MPLAWARYTLLLHTEAICTLRTRTALDYRSSCREVGKAAVHHLTRILAAHLIKEHIIVNAIAPGPFPTWMLSAGVGFGGAVEGDGVDWDRVGAGNPSGRVGAMEDIAGLAIFLSSRAGQYTVGETIACDGGSVACA